MLSSISKAQACNAMYEAAHHRVPIQPGKAFFAPRHLACQISSLCIRLSFTKHASTTPWLCSQLTSYTEFLYFIVTGALSEKCHQVWGEFGSKVLIVGETGEAVQEEAVGSIASYVDLRLQEEKSGDPISLLTFGRIPTILHTTHFSPHKADIMCMRHQSLEPGVVYWSDSDFVSSGALTP